MSPHTYTCIYVHTYINYVWDKHTHTSTYDNKFDFRTSRQLLNFTHFSWCIYSSRNILSVVCCHLHKAIALQAIMEETLILLPAITTCKLLYYYSKILQFCAVIVDCGLNPFCMTAYSYCAHIMCVVHLLVCLIRLVHWSISVGSSPITKLTIAIASPSIQVSTIINS